MLDIKQKYNRSGRIVFERHHPECFAYRGHNWNQENQRYSPAEQKAFRDNQKIKVR